MKNLSIGLKIATAFVVVLLLIVIMSIISFQNISRYSENSEWLLHTEEVLHEIELLSGALIDAETGQRGYIITGNEGYLEPFNNAVSRLSANMSLLRRQTSDNINQQKRITRLQQLMDKKLDELGTTIELRRNHGFEAARDVVVNDHGKTIMDEIRSVLIEMEEEEILLRKQRTKQTNNSINNSRINIISVAIAALIIIIVMSIYLNRLIALPIRNISEISQEIARGDLTTKVKIHRKDEVGELADSFRMMQESMRIKAEFANRIANGDLTFDFEPASDKDLMGISFALMLKNLRSQMNTIDEAVNSLTESTSEIMATVSQLASSAAETATTASEVTTTTEEVKQTAEVSNQKAKNVSVSSQKATQISIKGAEAINATINGMNNIRQQMESIANIVVQLSEQSQTIGEITSSVNDLAEQSNLLAVNASIEAAKAGDHGKGFAVVAQEIKSLAERSKEATGQIRSIIAEIQKSISNSVMATEEGGKAVDEGINLSETSGIAIKTLTISIEDAAEAAIQIAASSQQQLVGMEEMSSAIGNIKDASIQTADSIKQTEAAVGDLHSMGEKLQNILGQYKAQ
jgi:methyl-accepting chemotaxis protein